MVKKLTNKRTIIVLLAVCIMALILMPAQASAVNFSDITDMPQLLASCVATFDESTSVGTVWKEFPYVYEYLGEFSATAYCGCASCNGVWAGSPAANGEKLTNDLTIAVDPRVIPLGSYLIIEGVGIRKAQDTGSAIKGKDIDVYVSSHSKCSDFGRRSLKVWIIPEEVIDALHRADNYFYSDMVTE